MSSNRSSGGIGLLGGLTILFIALKLLGSIEWNWFWVLSPISLPIGLIIGFLGIWLLYMILK